MAENIANKDRLKDITDSIETGIKELFQSDKYMQYLRTMSRFHKYSVNNTMLIYMQKPDATLVAGFNKWRDQFERNVKKGEHGIKIIAPTPFKKKIEKERLDPDTKMPILDADGKVITEEKEIKIPMYKPVTVFDVSQTDGKSLPTLASDLAGNVQNYDVFMEALRRSSPVPIAYEKIRDGADGYFHLEEERIAIREGMSEVQTVSAAIHEITHAKLHNRERERLAAAQSYEAADVPKPKDRRTEEVEAESVSYAVCAYYGIATGENSFGYIATWSKGKDLPELQASLETINKTSSGLITDIDRHFAEIAKERGINLTAAPEQAAEKAVEDMNVLEMIDHFMSQGMTEDQANNLANSEWQARKTFGQAETVSLPPAINKPVTDFNGTWRYYIIPDLKTWATNAAKQTEIEYYEAFEATKQRFLDLRGQWHNEESNDLNPSGEPYARLTLGIDLTDGVSAADILHVRGGQNYLVDDFTRMKNLRNNPVVMDVLARVADEIGFNRVKGYERAEGGSYIPAPDIPFEQWNNSYFKVKEPKRREPSLEIDDKAETQTEPENIVEGIGAGARIIDVRVEEYPAPQAPHTGSLPDPAMSIEAMNAYGYTDDDMLPLSKERAMELFELDITVYMLYEGNGAGMAFKPEDIQMHTGIFGITREEWESVNDSVPIMDTGDAQKRLVNSFLNNPTDSYAIYQLQKGDELRDYRFESMEHLHKAGLSVESGNYKLVYTGELHYPGDTYDKLNGLYQTFNINHPVDFTGHSLSVSDIVALKQNGVVSCHYVDSFGFQELLSFLQPENYLKSAEMAMEDDYGMLDDIINNGQKATIAELEQQAKSGQPISLMDLAAAVKREQEDDHSAEQVRAENRPSVLEQLKAYENREKAKTPVRKSAERDL